MTGKLIEFERKEWRKYHIPGCSNLHTMKINAIHLSVANSKEHEMAKCKLAYDLIKEGNKIITEAEENSTKLRRDLVCITTGEIYEIETEKSRAERHPKNINVIMVNKLNDEEPVIRSRIFFKEDFSLKEPVIVNREVN